MESLRFRLYEWSLHWDCPNALAFHDSLLKKLNIVINTLVANGTLTLVVFMRCWSLRKGQLDRRLKTDGAHGVEGTLGRPGLYVSVLAWV